MDIKYTWEMNQIRNPMHMEIWWNKISSINPDKYIWVSSIFFSEFSFHDVHMN